MLIKKLIIGLLSFYAFEVKNNSSKKDLIPYDTIRIEWTYEVRRRKEIKKTKTYNNRKWKKKKQFIEPAFKITGTKPKDVRFSNQQKLRRMFRNC